VTRAAARGDQLPAPEDQREQRGDEMNLDDEGGMGEILAGHDGLRVG
jgi:hypothetical protein